MSSSLLTYLMTALFTLGFGAIYFQAIGPITHWFPFSAQPLLFSGQWGLLAIIIFAAAFGLAKLIRLDSRMGYQRKPKLVVQQ